jgi:hypothetical protein
MPVPCVTFAVPDEKRKQIEALEFDGKGDRQAERHRVVSAEGIAMSLVILEVIELAFSNQRKRGPQAPPRS